MNHQISKIVDGISQDYMSYNHSSQLTSTIYSQKNKTKCVLNKVLNIILEATFDWPLEKIFWNQCIPMYNFKISIYIYIYNNNNIPFKINDKI